MADIDQEVAERHPEQRLWCAVIGRALHDALDAVAAASDRGDRLRIRDEARRWFVLNGPEYRDACESAGYDPDYVRQRFLQLMAD